MWVCGQVARRAREVECCTRSGETFSPSVRKSSISCSTSTDRISPLYRLTMSTQTITKKRKSADGATESVKKVKTVKSADKPAPLKSALKKSKSITTNGNKVAQEDTIAVTGDTGDGNTTELTPDQTAALLAGFSSEEEEASEDEGGVAVSKLPKVPTTGAAQKKIKQAIDSQGKSGTSDGDPENTPGVIYIGRIPHGFYEPQMLAYFSQFGEILHLRLMRNRKTGKSQHYGFIEFASAAVAEIVRKTMDKYLLFGHILQVRTVPREQVNENMWRKSARKARKVAPRNRLEGSRLRRGATREQWEARVQKEEKKRAEKKAMLAEMGYEFDMPAVKSVEEVPARPKAIESAALGEEPEAGSILNTTSENVPTTANMTKKRSASGKTETKKAIKKVKA
jgi:nucleolar protein 15